MSEDNQLDNDPERTLITLEQLSQTIEVMTSVVNRLRQHLSEQLKAQIETQHKARESAKQETKQTAQRNCAAAETPPAHAESSINPPQPSKSQDRESFVVEIRQQENEPVRKSSKTLH